MEKYHHPSVNTTDILNLLDNDARIGILKLIGIGQNHSNSDSEVVHDEKTGQAEGYSTRQYISM